MGHIQQPNILINPSQSMGDVNKSGAMTTFWRPIDMNNVVIAPDLQVFPTTSYDLTR